MCQQPEYAAGKQGGFLHGMCFCRGEQCLNGLLPFLRGGGDDATDACSAVQVKPQLIFMPECRDAHFFPHAHGLTVVEQGGSLPFIVGEEADEGAGAEASQLALADDERPQLVGVEQPCQLSAGLLQLCRVPVFFQHGQQQGKTVHELRYFAHRFIDDGDGACSCVLRADAYVITREIHHHAICLGMHGNAHVDRYGEVMLLGAYAFA